MLTVTPEFVCPTLRKRRYPNKKTAKKAATHTQQHHPKRKKLRAYLCDCGVWHLTSNTNRQRQSERVGEKLRSLAP